MSVRSLAVDVGQSGIRLCESDGTDVRKAPVGVRPLVDEAAIDLLVDAVTALVGDSSPLHTLTVGLSGYVVGGTRTAQLADRLAAATQARLVCIAADAVTAYLGTLGVTPGTTAICGTGVAVLGWDGHTASRRIDARGYLLGDHGSGFWIGQHGLRMALDAREGRGGSDVLAEASERLGSREAIYQAAMAPSPARYVAGFAPDVLRAAKDGDGIARAVVNEAGTEIVRSITAARFGPGAIGLTGGLVNSPVFVAAVEEALREAGLDGEPLHVVPDAALAGAQRLASDWPTTRSGFPDHVVVKEYHAA